MVIPYRASGGIYNGTKLNPFEGTYTSCGWSYLRYKGQYVYETAMSGDMVLLPAGFLGSGARRMTQISLLSAR